MKSHYETLGVSSTASKDEIKKIYRSLVMKYHPDTSKVKSTANETKFKQISEAYAVLSDDKKRRQFDLELEEFKKFGRIKRPQGGGPGRAGAHGMAYKFHVLDGIYKPKNMIIGLALGFATVATLKSALGIEEEESRMQKNKREDGKTKLVEAWYNKQTRQWEQPAPWNEHFRKLNPPIEMVDRNKVRQSTS